MIFNMSNRLFVKLKYPIYIEEKYTQLEFSVLQCINFARGYTFLNRFCKIRNVRERNKQLDNSLKIAEYVARPSSTSRTPPQWVLFSI